MNIAWFTPLSRKSAIARCSQIVVNALRGLANVEVFYFDTGEVLPVDAPKRRLSSHTQADPALMSRFDIVIYNFGNHLPFHKEVYEVSKRWPGVCVLHDFVMQHFFASYYIDQRGDAASYIELMEHCYGRSGHDLAIESIYGAKIWESQKVIDYPLFEALILNAEGVVTHSEFFRKRVVSVFAGPIRRIPLPFLVDRTSVVLTRESLGIRDDSLLVLTIGHVNPNKKICSVVEALGSLRSPDPNFTYAIVGACARDERRKIDDVVQTCHLQGKVRVVGEVSDEVMRAYLHHADLCINLRYPAFEGASASAVEEMLFGKPIVVADTGFYSELPDDCVVKIDPLSKSQLEEVLKRLVSSSGESERVRLGQMAERYATQQFRADLYARHIIDFAHEVRGARPLLGLADTVGHELSRMGLARDSGFVDSFATELHELFNHETSQEVGM